MNELLAVKTEWRDEYAASRAQDPDRLRLARIYAARESLISDLSDWIKHNPANRQWLPQNNMLLNAAIAHKATTDQFGRNESQPIPANCPTSRETIIAANLAKSLSSVWTGRGSAKVIDAFVAEVMTWLTGRAAWSNDNKTRKAKKEAVTPVGYGLLPLLTTPRRMCI